MIVINVYTNKDLKMEQCQKEMKTIPDLILEMTAPCAAVVSSEDTRTLRNQCGRAFPERKPVKPIPRRERQKIAQRQEMLAAALELIFQKRMPQRIRCTKSPQKSEFAIGTLYKFFSNKEDLYKALILELSDRFHAALSKAIESPGDEIEKLRRYVQAKGEVFSGIKPPLFVSILPKHAGPVSTIMAGLDQDIRNRRERFLGAHCSNL